MKITINGTRYDLSTMIALGASTPENSGVSISEIFFGPKSNRLITETYSIWENRSEPGTTVGTCYTVLDPTDPDWADSMQHAHDNCAADHKAALLSAMDKHVPALVA